MLTSGAYLCLRWRSITWEHGSLHGGNIIVDPDSGEPDKKRTNRIHKYALENGLIMITAGTYGNIIRTLMPLTIKEDELSRH